VETCNQCHPVFNKDRVVKKVVKGRMEKFLEKEKKMASIKKKK
jgi:ribosomal protein L31